MASPTSCVLAGTLQSCCLLSQSPCAPTSCPTGSQCALQSEIRNVLKFLLLVDQAVSFQTLSSKGLGFLTVHLVLVFSAVLAAACL